MLRVLGVVAVTGLTVADRCHARRLEEMPVYRLPGLFSERGWLHVAAPGQLAGPRFARRLQRLLVTLLVYDMEPVGKSFSGNVVDELESPWGRLLYLEAPGGVAADAVLRRGPGGLRRRMLELLPLIPRPVVAIDFSLAWSHLPSEARSLRKQVGAALGVLRAYLWDAHLLLASLSPGLLEWLRGFLGRALVQRSWLPADEALMLRGYRRIILLDPSAEEPLTPRDAMEADAFILGGIVDRMPRPGATRRLSLRGFYEARRLVLRGETHGVPNRLNMLVEILLRARYIHCGDLEKAIIEAMAPRDVRLRAVVEISRWLRGRRAVVPWSLYCELRSWLPLTPRDFVKAVRMAGGEPPQGQPECGAQQRPNTSWGQR